MNPEPTRGFKLFTSFIYKVFVTSHPGISLFKVNNKNTKITIKTIINKVLFGLRPEEPKIINHTLKITFVLFFYFIKILLELRNVLCLVLFVP